MGNSGPNSDYFRSIFWPNLSLISYRFSKERDSHTHDLQIQREKIQNAFSEKMEGIKRELDLIATNQKVQFASLHKKRAKAILGLHTKMVALKGYVWQASNEDPRTLKRIEFLEKAVTNFDELDKSFCATMLYFKPSLCEKLLEFINTGRWLIAHQHGQNSQLEPKLPEEIKQAQRRDKEWKRLEIGVKSLAS